MTNPKCLTSGVKHGVTKQAFFRHYYSIANMTEKDLIKKIQEISQIKPRKEWVLLTKSQILGEDAAAEVKLPHLCLQRFLDGLTIFPKLVLQRKPALISLVVIMGVFVSILGLAQNSLPGDIFYPVKKLAEKGQNVFASEKDQPRLNLESANRRLDDLTRIAESNKVRNLELAINEFQASVSAAAKSLAERRLSGDKEAVRQIALQVKKLEENKQKITSLGVVTETGELELAIKEITGRELKDMESKNLTEGQQKLLQEAKKDFEAGDYSGALGKILEITQI